MISWIQKYFQHHFRIIFGILLVLIIISFVFVTNTSGGLGRADRIVVERHFFGHDLNTPEGQQRLFGDAQLSAGLQTGMFGGFPAEQIQQFALTRAAALHLAAEWHIPAATDAELTEAIKKLRSFQGQDGQFDAKAYGTFLDNLKTNPRGMTQGDIKRVLSDDVRVEKVNKLLAGPGYVLPTDVKQQLARSDTTWTIATATTNYADFKIDVTPADAELTKFFEESSFRYEIPPRVVVRVAEFPTTNFLAQVNVTEADVRAFYEQNPARFPKPPEVKPATPTPLPAPPADPAADYAKVRSNVEAALRLERAQRLAVKAASDLTLQLFESKVTNGPTLDTYLAAKKLTAKVLPPFTADAPPAELGGSREAAAEAFKLNEKNFVSEPLATPAGAVVLFWQATQASRKPLFSEVKEKVQTDYLESEKRKRFVELGKSIKGQLEARLKAGDTFEQAAVAVSNAKLEAKSIAAFTRRNRPQDLDYSADDQLDRLEKGQLSDMVLSADKGLFVYAADKKAPDLTEANPQFVETRTRIAAYTSQMGGSAYLSELVTNELKKSEPKAP